MIAVAALAGHGFARVVRFEVVTRADVLNGKSWGKVGAYEKIVPALTLQQSDQGSFWRRTVNGSTGLEWLACQVTLV